MSNEWAVAATTATLRAILEKGINHSEPNPIDVTHLPPDVVGKGTAKDQINLFLYETSLSAAWRNTDIPRQTRPGETAPPLLPLTLSYLLSAYSKDNDDLVSHRLLGKAMRILQDNAVLSHHEIEDATSSDPRVSPSNLHQQLEHVRVTPLPPSIEDIWKLWTAFQTPYRVSAAYQVSVLLIESRRPLKASLPVLTRGQDDHGVITLLGGMPFLDSVRPPARRTAVQFGDAFSLLGTHLAGGTIQVVLRGPLGTGPFSPASLPSVRDEEIEVKLPDAGNPADPGAPRHTWPAGFYTAQVVVSRSGEPDRTSNELPFALAPAIQVTTIPGPRIRVKCTPDVKPEQRISLLLGERELQPVLRTIDTFEFIPPAGIPHDDYVVRLRVDGVDSIPLDPNSPTPKFDPAQKVTLP